MAKIDYVQLRRNVHKQAINSVKNLAIQSARVKFDSAREQLLTDFENHPVTIEIESGKDDGVDAENITGTLDGKGNLWGFIGFEEGSDPIGDVRTQLEKTKLNERPTVESRGSKLEFTFTVKSPDMKELEQITPMPWEGRSWLVAVENFITGLSSFMYWKSSGRSGAGLQAKTRKGSPQILRNTRYKPIKYLSVILDRFKDRFTK